MSVFFEQHANGLWCKSVSGVENARAKTIVNEEKRNETWIAWIAVDCPINHTYVMLNIYMKTPIFGSEYMCNPGIYCTRLFLPLP